MLDDLDLAEALAYLVACWRTPVADRAALHDRHDDADSEGGDEGDDRG